MTDWAFLYFSVLWHWGPKTCYLPSGSWIASSAFPNGNSAPDPWVMTHSRAQILCLVARTPHTCSSTLDILSVVPPEIINVNLKIFPIEDPQSCIILRLTFSYNKHCYWIFFSGDEEYDIVPILETVSVNENQASGNAHLSSQGYQEAIQPHEDAISYLPNALRLDAWMPGEATGT